MAKKQKALKKVPKSRVSTFKIKNRRGYAAVCINNLTEGSTIGMALARMSKALKRSGYTLG